MRTIWYSLFWKEWHEHKWKLASIVAILWGVAVIVLCSFRPDEKLPVGIALTTVCLVPLAVFVGLGAAANERGRGTLRFLQALPTPMWRVAVVKLVMGIVTLVVPAVLGALLLYTWTSVADTSRAMRRSVEELSLHSATGSWFLDIVVVGSLLAASLFIWAAATGVNRKDEVTAGATSLAVMVGWSLFVFLFGFATWQSSGTLPVQSNDQEERLVAVAISTVPGGFIRACSVPEQHRHLGFVVFTAVLMHFGLLAWYVGRFGRIDNLEVHSPHDALRDSKPADWLSPPQKFEFTAIAWKQFRESAPLVMAGLAGVIGIVAIFFLADSGTRAHFSELFAGVSVSLGCGVALIVGIGVCLNDVNPAINTFWRSRPINPDLWFWTKFGTGMLVLLVAVYLPLILVVFAFHPDPYRVLLHPRSLMLPVAHISIYAAAVAATCLVRHAVYSAILSIPAIFFGVSTVWLALRGAERLGWIHKAPEYLTSLPATQSAAGFALSFVSCMLLAWLAMRNDWGWKSRY